MSVEATKETLCINQIIGKKVDTAIIEEDFVVPDIKPDILNAINTSGVVCIYKKEVMDGKIRMDGCVNTYIMYLADDGESAVRSLNVNLDFSHIVDFSNLKIGMMVETNVAIKTIEWRKINVRAILEIELNAYSNEDLEFVQQIGDIKDVQLLKENLSINSLLGTGNTKVYAKDTIMIDSVDDLAEIMKVNLDIRNREIKVSYNKILVKADCIVKIMYLTGDNRICTKTASIPVMGFVDMPNVTDDNICEVNFEIKNILIKPNSIEEHSIYVEMEVQVKCMVYEEKQITDTSQEIQEKIGLNELGEEETIIEITVTAEKQEIQKTYKIHIKRPYGKIKGKIQLGDGLKESMDGSYGITMNYAADLRIYKQGQVNWDDIIPGNLSLDDVDSEQTEKTTKSDDEGNYEIYVIPGKYDFYAERQGFLADITTKITINENDEIDLGNKILYEGDADRSGIIDLNDTIEIVNSMGASVGDSTYSERYDFGQKGYVSLDDMVSVVGNLYKTIKIQEYTG